ncbi:hypothetical protein E2C01_095938 [Portunus trituberculatus]|uniref:Uncharacterized protein n=1 Tax=Portunus trituberculatus TaxID=210409 RepID=A0A5B7K6Y0_PORTR|nr:hypothetical protein [Portunus trituberculatus]
MKSVLAASQPSQHRLMFSSIITTPPGIYLLELSYDSVYRHVPLAGLFLQNHSHHQILLNTGTVSIFLKKKLRKKKKIR